MLLKSLVVYALLFKGVIFAKKNNNTETRLLKHILDGYNKDVRPLKNISQPISIKMGLNLKQIISVDFTHQVLKLQVWVRLFWRDEFISWNPDDYDGKTMITIDQSVLWTPEVALYNSVSMSSADPGRLDMIYKMVVYHDGNIKLLSPAVMSSECKVQVSHFPFDSQYCYLEFGSWSEHGGIVDFNTQYPYIDNDSFSPNDEWMLHETKSWKKVKKYSCCKDPFPSIIFALSLKRRAMFYFLNLIVPCGLLTVVSMFSFILPPNSGERVSFVITVLLALAVYMMMVTNTMPHSSQTPLASKFFLFVIVQQSLSLVMTCFVIRYHNNEQQLPKWFDFLVNKCLARILCMDYCSPKNRAAIKESDLIKRTIFANSGFLKDDDNVFQARDASEKTENNKNSLGLDKQKQTSNLEEENVKLVEEVRVISDKIRDMNTKEKLQDEWIFAAQVLDRFFVLSLMVSIFIAFLWIFLSIPDGSILT